jgi:lipopolysaccharide/colanic/teichoic acid biosynthesis glycosyltransferase
MIQPAEWPPIPEEGGADADPGLEQDPLIERPALYEAVKRAVDIVLSATALVVLFPVMLVIALVILLDDPRGGPIFSQTRCGLNGRHFTLYKFRTMVVGAEKRLAHLTARNEMSGPAFKIRNDPRITRAGRALRKTGLDELPQFFNVLRGEMSLVGPRPPLPNEYARYDERQSQRLLIKPGITCYWQIQPQRNSLNFDQWLELDLKYLRDRSLAVDLKILFKTFYAMCTAQGE